MGKNREHTKEKIFRAVLNILEKDGFTAVGINLIAREAGVDKVLIYRYFGGMPELLAELAVSGLIAFKPENAAISSVMRDSKILRQIMIWGLAEKNPLSDELMKAWKSELASMADEIRFMAKNKGFDAGVSTEIIASGLLFMSLITHDYDWIKLDKESKALINMIAGKKNDDFVY